ncbi:MAG: hypothetical protein WBB69_11745 [Anaerolineales bacterium]
MKGYLVTLFPFLANIKMPASRDQLMLLMAAVNEIFLGVDIYLAHKLSGTIVLREWIPIIFGPVAGVLLLFAGLIAINRRNIAVVIANLVFLASILVGLLGAYFHFIRAILPTAAPGSRVSIDLLVWAPPIVGPLVFSLVGLLGISAVWREDPVSSGRLLLFSGKHLQLPYSKTQAFFFMVSLGTLATLISSVLDHARTSFENPWLWVPVISGILGVLSPAIMALIPQPKRGDILIYFTIMLLLILVGVIGTGLHILENLTSQGQFVAERFIRGAPFLAPLLFANMGALGIINLVDPG